MSKFTRNLRAIKKLNIEKTGLIDHLAFINKMIGKKHCLSTLFIAKNAVFNKLCKIQDILALELKLNKILMNKQKINDSKIRYKNMLKRMIRNTQITLSAYTKGFNHNRVGSPVFEAIFYNEHRL